MMRYLTWSWIATVVVLVPAHGIARWYAGDPAGLVVAAAGPALVVLGRWFRSTSISFDELGQPLTGRDADLWARRRARMCGHERAFWDDRLARRGGRGDTPGLAGRCQ